MTQNKSDSVITREFPLLDNHKLPNIEFFEESQYQKRIWT